MVLPFEKDYETRVGLVIWYWKRIAARIIIHKATSKGLRGMLKLFFL